MSNNINIDNKKESNNFTFIQLMLAGIVIYAVSQLAYICINNFSTLLTGIINIAGICLIGYLFVNVMKKADTYNASLIENARIELGLSLMFGACIGMSDKIVSGGIMVAKIKIMAFIIFIAAVISIIRKIPRKNVVLIAGQLLLGLFMLSCLEEVIGQGELFLAAVASQVILIKEVIKFINKMNSEDRADYERKTSQQGIYGDEKYTKIMNMMEQSKKYTETKKYHDDTE